MASPREIVKSESTINVSTETSNNVWSLYSATSQKSFSQLMPSDSEQNLGGSSPNLEALRIDSNPPPQTHPPRNTSEFPPSLQGFQRNLVYATPSVPQGITYFTPDSNNLPPSLFNLGSNSGNRGYAGPTVSAAPTTQFRAVNGVNPISATIAYELNTLSIMQLITTGVHNVCNQCHMEKDIVKFYCGHYLCIECIIINCILDIREFDNFLERNELQNLRRKFSYRCPVCTQSLNIPTDLIFRFTEIRMELSKLGNEELVYKEDFAWLDSNRTRLIEFSPYFDGIKATFVPCNCGSICLQLSTNVFLCRNYNFHNNR